MALIALAAITAGLALSAADAHVAANVVWAGLIVALLVPLTWKVLRTLMSRRVGVDAIALLAMATALVLGEYLAGAVVALMLSGGYALEEAAAGRARSALRALVERAPRIAHRRVDDRLEEVDVSQLVPGDEVVVRAGEVIPVDGVVLAEVASVDEAALTGESLPVELRRGHGVRSGTANAGEAFDMRATRSSADSAYSALVKLVQHAEGDRAPFVRMADRYAALLLPFTLIVAAVAWQLSGDPVRILAVLVVATPCPLILAAPIAFIAGISRAAHAGVIVKSGGAIEQLGLARSVLLDKTGTLTLGQPEIESVHVTGLVDEDELLRLAASLDQMSAHVLAEALVHEVESRGVRLSLPESVAEIPGQGVTGTVSGRDVVVGGRKLLIARGVSGVDELAARLDGTGGAGHATIYVSVDGRAAAAIVMADKLRDDAHELADALRAAGVGEVAMVTGDRREVAERVATAAGIDRVYWDQAPEQKLEVVRAMQHDPDRAPVVMVGDGINDAPALALADVGIAMGSAGATVSSEAADAVIMVPQIGRVVTALRVGRRSLAIARQSVLIGIGLSMVAMGFAAAGYIPPVAGALLQEAIDVTVILNALRALR